MIRRLFREEAGYSLVEVIVAMMILTMAIIPMVGMFDAGLRAVVFGGNYDKGRALANEKLEEVKALPYDAPPNPPVNSIVEKYPPLNANPAGSAVACPPSPSDYAPFECRIETRYVVLTDSAVADDADARTMMKITVTVSWDAGASSYSTTGLVSKESPESK